jgi:hypothetical protein
MKPKYLKTFYLFLKSLPIFGISKRFTSIKIIFDRSKKILKSLFFKIHLRLFNLLGQILFLAIILLFLFLLSIYFSQIKFLKKHSDFFNFSSLNLNHKQLDNSNSFLSDKINIYEFILSPIFFKNHLCHSLHKPLKTASNIKIDYG